MEARVIDCAAGGGAWNMAVDDVLLETMTPRDCAILRFYRWSEPTVTLGYFQHYSHGDLHATSRSCPRIRRTTGGGAIVHDHELTYSFVTSLATRSDRS